MSNAFASALFLARNTDKIQHGDIARTPVVVAQSGSLVKKISQLDTSLGKGTQSALDAFENSSKLKFGSKAINVAGELVNPLLVAAAAYRVGTADDKEAALYKEGGAMGSMFAAEGLMKNKVVKEFVRQKGDNVTEQGIKILSKIIKPLEKMSETSKNKVVKTGSFIIAGVAMVAASIMGYSVGAEVGTDALNKKRNLFNDTEHSKKTVNADIENEESHNSEGKKLTIES